jgi:hypothetical protein
MNLLSNRRNIMHHFWHKETFEFTHSAELPPGRTPPNGTDKPIPSFDSETQKLMWNQFTNEWQVLSLKEWTAVLVGIGWKNKSDQEKINDLGEIVPKTREELITEGLITKESVLQSKLQEISSKARIKIEGGFESNAKGQWYIYDSTLEDQFNIKTLADSGIDSLLRCTKKSTAVKDFYPHTSAQLNQLVSEYAQYKTGILQTAHNHKVTVLAMETALEIESYMVAY